MNSKAPVAVTLLLCGFACTSRIEPTTVVQGPEAVSLAVLTVEVVGLESDRGEVAVALYDSADSFDDRSGAVATEWLRPKGGAISWTVEGLDPGDYAVAVYHDLNGNGQLDRSSLGPPSEPYGFSNDARGTFGPPGFRKAAVRIVPGAQTIRITTR